MADSGNIAIDGELIDSMRVVDLKKHLDYRGLSKSGSKTQLVERLKTRIQLENEQTQNSDSHKEDDSTTDEDQPSHNYDKKPTQMQDLQNEFAREYEEQQQKLNAMKGREIRNDDVTENDRHHGDFVEDKRMSSKRSTTSINTNDNREVSRQSSRKVISSAEETEKKDEDVVTEEDQEKMNQSDIDRREVIKQHDNDYNEEDKVVNEESMDKNEDSRTVVEDSNKREGFGVERGEESTDNNKETENHFDDRKNLAKCEDVGDKRNIRRQSSKEDKSTDNVKDNEGNRSIKRQSSNEEEKKDKVSTDNIKKSVSRQNSKDSDVDRKAGLDDQHGSDFSERKKISRLKDTDVFTRGVDDTGKSVDISEGVEIEKNVSSDNIVNKTDDNDKHEKEDLNKQGDSHGDRRDSKGGNESMIVEDDDEELDYDENMEVDSEDGTGKNAGDSKDTGLEEGELPKEGKSHKHKSKSKHSHRSSDDKKSRHSSKRDKSRDKSHDKSPQEPTKDKKFKRSPIRVPDSSSSNLTKTRVKGRKSEDRDRESRRRSKQPTEDTNDRRLSSTAKEEEKKKTLDVVKMEDRVTGDQDSEKTVASSTTPTEPGKTIRQLNRRSSRTSKDEDKAKRKRKWGSGTRSSSNSYNISTESLKGLIPEIKEPFFKMDSSPDRISSPVSEVEDTRDVKIQRVINQDVKVQNSDETKADDEPTDDPALQDNDKTDEVKNDENLDEKSQEKVDETGSNDNKSDTEEKQEEPIIVKRVLSKQSLTPRITAPVKLEMDEPKAARRSPSPPKHPESCILHITNLTRPFTLVQLKDLLKRTGSLNEDDFWIDKIKSHCFVAYEEVEMAVATRKALHGTKWPSSNPKNLRLEFSTPKELEYHRARQGSLTTDIQTKKKKAVTKPDQEESAERKHRTSAEDKSQEDKTRRDDARKNEDKVDRSSDRRTRDNDRPDRSRERGDRLREDNRDRRDRQNDRRAEKPEVDERKRREDGPVREWDIGKVRDDSPVGARDKSRDRLDERGDRRSDPRYRDRIDDRNYDRRDMDRRDDRRRDMRDRMDRDGDRQDGERRDRERRNGERERSSETKDADEKTDKENAKQPDEQPVGLLDDLFKKTAATPSIYWLPLTDKQVTERLERMKKIKIFYKTESEYLNEEIRRPPFPMGFRPPPGLPPHPPMLLGPPPMPMGRGFFQHDRRRSRSKDRSKRSGSHERRRTRKSRSREQKH